jgi:MoaA/NifB/PqqE/SkfB family radical SAM enzyme
MTTTLEHPTATTTEQRIASVALDITRKCQLSCKHCYNESAPTGTHGTMTLEDWIRTLDQAHEMGAQRVQLIGGEPTQHPDLPDLIAHGLKLGMAVEVFSNLVAVSKRMWTVLSQPGVSLATSWYSNGAEQHDVIANRPGAYERTKANIAKARELGIPVRGAIVDVMDGQRVEQAKAELLALGVTEVRVDRMRKMGRAAGDGACGGPSELCGKCAVGRVAIRPDGEVAGCVMAAGMGMTVGDVRQEALGLIVGGARWEEFRAVVPPRPAAREGCTPDEDSCQPSPGADPFASRTVTGCNPDNDSSDCSPAESEACEPAY